MRMVQNNFVSGAISPELNGRIDIEAYFQAAAEIENFVVKRTGGLKKRAGTQLLFNYKNLDIEAFRCVPFLFSRTEVGMLIIFTQKGDYALRAKFFKMVNGTKVGEGEVYKSTEVVIEGGQEFFDRIKYKQLGDNVYFTKRGMRAFKIEVFWEEARLEISQLSNKVAVADAPPLTSKATGFETDEEQGYIKTRQKYRLYGFKGGVMSKESENNTTIYLPWVADAKVSLTFTPDWTKHDYYIVCKMLGVDYGVLQAFYPTLDSGKGTDWVFGTGSDRESATINNNTYVSNVFGSLPTAWSTNDFNAKNPDGTSTTGALIYRTMSFSPASTITNKSAPILAISIYCGGVYKRQGEDVYDTIGGGTNNTITLYRQKNDESEKIAEWRNQNLAYSSNPLQLIVKDVVNGYEDGRYELTITNPNGNEVFPIRGIVINTDIGEKKLVDDRIEPTDLQGVQEMLTVGDAGMDCDVMALWQQRLMYASSPNAPFTMWFSQVGDLNNFYTNRPQTEDSAFSASIPPVASSKILHAISTSRLLVFTECGEYLVSSGDNVGFAFSTINIRQTSIIGAAETVEPISTEQWVIFVAQDLRMVYDIQYQLESDNLVPKCLNALAMHILEKSRIKKVVSQRFPDSVYYFLLNDGTLAGMTYMPEQQVLAWHHHSFSGGEGLELVDVCSCNSITDVDLTDATSDVFLVWREEGTTGNIYVERMKSGSIVDKGEGNLIECCDHCGYTEEVFPKGINPKEAVKAHFVTLRPELKQESLKWFVKNILSTVFRVRRSGKVSVRPEHGNEPAMSIDKSVKGGDGTVELYSGDMMVLPRSFLDRDGMMRVISDDEYPCEILSVLFNVDVGDYDRR